AGPRGRDRDEREEHRLRDRDPVVRMPGAAVALRPRVMLAVFAELLADLGRVEPFGHAQPPATMTSQPACFRTSAATSSPNSEPRKPWWCSPTTMTPAPTACAASTIDRPGSPAAHR